MRRYYPKSDPAEPRNAFADSSAQRMDKVLRLCGDDLTRENLMRKATTLAGVQLPMLLPGMAIDSSPTDYSVISQAQLARFDGKQWVPFGELLSGR